MVTRRDVLRALLGAASGACVPRSTAARKPDVCIVGTGPGGTLLAIELARKGFSCVLVEGGSGQQVGQSLLPQEYPIESTRFRGLGGTSNLWGGSCSRFHPRDFERGGWPLRYEDIEPYYGLAERELGVAGRSSRHAPGRSTDYPEPVPPDYANSLTSEVFSAAGVDVEYPPMATRRRMLDSHLPAIRASTAVQLIEGVRVRRVVSGSDGHVTALEATGPDGLLQIVASCYVLACGGIETPRLLLMSRSTHAPNGIGNTYDLVGRNFMEHLWAPLGHAAVQMRTMRPSEEPMEALTWEYYSQLVEQGLGGAHIECLAGTADGVRVAGLWEMSPQPRNRVLLDRDHLDEFGDPTARVEIALSEMDRRTHEELLSIAEAIFARIKANRIVTSLTTPRWCHHHMGTCRMGTDPRTSVVDPQLRVHGTDNLYLVGSSTFCSGGAGPPTLLLVALALRLADYLSRTLPR